MFNITRITLITNPHRTDQIFLHTDLPSPYTFPNNDPTTLSLPATLGYGREYVEENFPGIPVEEIEDKSR